VGSRLVTKLWSSLLILCSPKLSTLKDWNQNLYSSELQIFSTLQWCFHLDFFVPLTYKYIQIFKWGKLCDIWGFHSRVTEDSNPLICRCLSGFQIFEGVTFLWYFVCLFPWASAASHWCTAACWLIVQPALYVPTLATRCPRAYRRVPHSSGGSWNLWAGIRTDNFA
jgi:hypothetical protein